MSKWKNLIEIADITTGFPFKGEKYSATGIRTIRGENVTEGRLRWDTIKCWNEPFEQEENYLLEKDDIVIGMDGSKVGKNKARIRQGDLPLLLAQRVACVRAKKGNDQIYLYYLINNPRFEKYVFKTQTGSSVPHISRKQIEDFKVPVFELPTQQKIASVLSALDDKIELNNRINAELEQMAKTLYYYWFVQFDFPNEEGKPYKSSSGKMVYNEVLKREIPEGWEVTVFNDWIQNTKTGDWGKEEVEGNYTERVYCVRGADINGLNGKGDIKAPERFILKNNLSKKLEPNDFIIEISGGSPTQSTARIALLTKGSFERFNTNVVCSNFCKAVTLKDEKYVYNFQQEWQRLYDAGVFFGFEGKTSGIKNFLFESFMDSYQIVKPEKELVNRFNSFAKIIEKKRQSNLKQNQELAQLRDWLLPMLMNGQVTVNSDYMPKDQNVTMAAEPAAPYKKEV